MKVKQILRYLRGTADLWLVGLVYKKNPRAPSICGFVDADFASEIPSRKSTSGFIIKVFSNTVMWGSRKQTMVALSTTESEFVATATAATEVLWFHKLLDDLHVAIPKPIVLYEDNHGAIFVSKNPETRRSKHYDIKFLFLQELTAAGIIELSYVCSEDQEADIMTKPLPASHFSALMKLLALQRGGVLNATLMPASCTRA